MMISELWGVADVIFKEIIGILIQIRTIEHIETKSVKCVSHL